MTPTKQFILRLEALDDGERSRLRRLGGKPLDETVEGFDLFTGLWWPLRSQSPAAPRRATSWLIVKLFGAFPIPYAAEKSASLPVIVGRAEPPNNHRRTRFRDRFDALLQTPLSRIEPPLMWALSVVAHEVKRERCVGLNWSDLLDDLSIWDLGAEHRKRRDIRDVWAEQYLNAVQNHQWR